MKPNFLLCSLIWFSILAFPACDHNDDHHMESEFEYHAHIHSPGIQDFHIGDVLEIDVDFESHTGMTIHHINVTIVALPGGDTLYTKPPDAHVHGESGSYQFVDHLDLNQDNGFMANGNYMLQARVWGHHDNPEEAMESVDFSILP